MIWKAIIAALLILLATKAMRGQNAPTGSTNGSISGQVINVATGLPVANAGVMIHMGATNATVNADAAGRYVARDLAPGSGTVYADDAELAAGAERTVILHAGENLRSFDLRLRPNGKISGKVVDAKGKPVPNMWVYSIAREYRWGSLHYFYADSTFTDSHGQFSIRNVQPGRGYLVMVGKDRGVRQFYPGVSAIEEATPITLRPGESRNDVDVNVVHSASFCVDGKALAGKDTEPLDLRVETAELNNGIIGDGDNITFVLPGVEPIAADGTFRVCGLPRGDWLFTLTEGTGIDPTLYGSELVSIVDVDVHDVTIMPRVRVSLPGEVVLEGARSDLPDTSPINVRLETVPARDSTLDRRAKTTLPGHFSIDNLMTGNYGVTVTDIPDGMYLKDVTYGSRSVRYEPLPAGSEPTGTGLRVAIARDGGFIHAKAAEGSWITAITATANTEAAISATHISGEADQSSVWKSPALPPGRYYVLATARELYMTPETLARIMVERLRTDPVDVGANATVTVSVIVTSIE